MDTGLDKFIKDQLSVWPLAAENHRNLKLVETKRLTVGGLTVTVQFNPCRVVSSEASMDKESLQTRPCFLCPEHRQKEQFHIDFVGRKGRKYRVTLNPYPIFPSHLVISSCDHTPQSIWHRAPDMLDFVEKNPGMVCFYNGPKGGASIPFHHHFQACPKGLMPLLDRVDSLLDSARERPAAGTDAVRPTALKYLSSVKEADIFHLEEFVRGAFILRSSSAKSLVKLFYRLLDCAPVVEGDTEPRFNLMVWRAEDGEKRAAVIFRRQLRPHHYYSTSSDHLSMSIGCADLGGVFITPREEDFRKLDERLLSEVIDEVCIDEEDQTAVIRRLTRSQPVLEVGVMSAPEIEFEIISDGAGLQRVSFSEGKVSYRGALYDELLFDARTLSTMFAEPSFVLHNVTIGVDFHWERRLSQKFAGALRFVADKGKVVAINIIGVEDYLLSVISSEMKATAGLEFLKAHSVISRSWVMSHIAHRELRRAKEKEGRERGTGPSSVAELVTRLVSGLADGPAADSSKEGADGGELIKWFDHNDHDLFDVCADDHCQRYQGLTMAVGENVRKAIDQTWGLVLTHDGGICDARFSKCCGGRTELFSTCWEDEDQPYLQSFPDTIEDGADPFCDTSDETILAQVLNDYDLETKDFYRWTNEYSRPALSDLVARRSGFDFGDILALEPLHRGPSGRIDRLRVVGSERTLVIGKELVIRKFLSESHLKSSAFTITYLDSSGDEVPESKVLEYARRGLPAWERLVLHGSGWGHGVGLCQIGAAVMDSKGCTYERILTHYYPGAAISRL